MNLIFFFFFSIGKAENWNGIKFNPFFLLQERLRTRTRKLRLDYWPTKKMAPLLEIFSFNPSLLITLPTISLAFTDFLPGLYLYHIFAACHPCAPSGLHILCLRWKANIEKRWAKTWVWELFLCSTKCVLSGPKRPVCVSLLGSPGSLCQAPEGDYGSLVSFFRCIINSFSLAHQPIFAMIL